MKNLKTIITVIALSLSTVFAVSATEKNPTKTSTNNLRSKIVKLLGKQAPSELLKTNKEAVEISFMINNNNEVVVISVDDSTKEIESYVKNKLNYKTVDVTGVKKGEVYMVPLTIKKN